MKTYIQDMNGHEIIEYLRYNNELLIHNFFDREGFNNNFSLSIDRGEWREFTEYCLKNDTEEIFNLAEKLFDKWCEKKCF